MKRFVSSFTQGFEILAGVMGQTTNPKDGGKNRVARSFPYRQAGFALIETLIVLTILTILTAMAIDTPVLIEARKGSNDPVPVRSAAFTQILDSNSSNTLQSGNVTYRLSECLPCQPPSITYSSSAVFADGTQTNLQLQATSQGADRPDLLNVTGVQTDPTTGAVIGLDVAFNPGGINELVKTVYANQVPGPAITLGNAVAFTGFFGGATIKSTSPPLQATTPGSP